MVADTDDGNVAMAEGDTTDIGGTTVSSDMAEKKGDIEDTVGAEPMAISWIAIADRLADTKDVTLATLEKLTDCKENRVDVLLVTKMEMELQADDKATDMGTVTVKANTEPKYEDQETGPTGATLLMEILEEKDDENTPGCMKWVEVK